MSANEYSFLYLPVIDITSICYENALLSRVISQMLSHRFYLLKRITA